MKTKLFASLLLLSAAAITPSYANYFSNPHTGITYNVGSAANPTPSDIRAERMAMIAKAEKSTTNPDTKVAANEKN